MAGGEPLAVLLGRHVDEVASVEVAVAVGAADRRPASHTPNVGRTEDGRVLSTTPFNYHVSGTACWVKNTALVRCANQCAEWRAEGFDAHVALEIHDEILFDFPRGKTVKENLSRAIVLKGLMEQSGEDLIPRILTPVSVELHTESWAKGVSL